jgi:glutamate--cysteine ligase
VIIILNKEYEKLELSTQILIENGLERGIKVEVLDWDDNFIRLTKGNKVEYVKQATRTSIDNYIVPFIMENKKITKLILKENKIKVPEGMVLKNIDEIVSIYEKFKNSAIVIKPNSTNFGKGVSILKKVKNVSQFKSYIEKAFAYDNTVLIEEFIPGREYRFLVIGEKVVAVLHRVAANVVGDGVHKISDLVRKKIKAL